MCIIEMSLLPCRACQEWCNQIRSEWISVINILIYLEFPFFPDGHKCYCFQNPTVVSTSRPSCYNICQYQIMVTNCLNINGKNPFLLRNNSAVSPPGDWIGICVQSIAPTRGGFRGGVRGVCPPKIRKAYVIQR